MTWIQLCYLISGLAAVLTILGFFKGPVKTVVAWVFQNGVWVLVSVLILAVMALPAFLGNLEYQSSCTGEGKAKTCLEKNSDREGVDGVVPCIRKLVLSNQLSAKRGREIMLQWDKNKAEFERQSVSSKTLPCAKEMSSKYDRASLSRCLRELIVYNKLSAKRGKAIMRQWDRRNARFERMAVEFEKKGD